MIILYYPRLAKPKNRRFPLSILALAAVLEGREDYQIVDGNVEADPDALIAGSLPQAHHVELLAVSVMPGPQMVSAMHSCKRIRAMFPHIPVVWGGYFPSVYKDAALNADYVDYVVRGQGENTLLELIAALRGRVEFSAISGLSYKTHDWGTSSQLRTSHAWPRRLSLEPLSSSSRGEISAPFVFWQADSSASG
jgi:anaerobic magnesium-protoporphyrin IX monomethyl ester cyclase